MVNISKPVKIMSVITAIIMYANAVGYCEQYVEKFNSRGQVDNWQHYDRGLKDIEVKDYRMAEQEFNFYLVPANADFLKHMSGIAHFGKGLMYQSMGNYYQAITEFKIAGENDLHPDVKIADKAFMNIGTIYYKQKDYKEAIRAYSKAAENNPRNGLAHFYLGMSYLRSGDIEKAEKEGESAKKLGVPYSGISDGLAERKNPQAKSEGVSVQVTHKKIKKGTKKKTAE